MSDDWENTDDILDELSNLESESKTKTTEETSKNILENISSLQKDLKTDKKAGPGRPKMTAAQKEVSKLKKHLEKPKNLKKNFEQKNKIYMPTSDIRCFGEDVYEQHFKELTHLKEALKFIAKNENATVFHRTIYKGAKFGVIFVDKKYVGNMVTLFMNEKLPTIRRNEKIINTCENDFLSSEEFK